MMDQMMDGGMMWGMGLLSLLVICGARARRCCTIQIPVFQQKAIGRGRSLTQGPIFCAVFLMYIASALIIGAPAYGETGPLVPGVRMPPKTEHPFDSRITSGSEAVVPISIEGERSLSTMKSRQ